MRLSGYQPHYFPRLHYFARLLDSDIFEFSDYVQFVKKHKFANPDGTSHRGKSYQADTPVKLGSGINYLTVPAAQHETRAINDTMVAADGWERKHLKAIFLGYRSAVQYEKLAPQLAMLLDGKYENLADLNIRTTIWALGVISGEIDQTKTIAPLEEVNDWLGQNNIFRLKKIVRISETSVLPSDDVRDATDWIIDMCHALGADEYYFGGTSAAAYMDFSRFKAAGIGLIQQNWICQPYRQQFPRLGFIPNLSIIDLLMNETPQRAQEILKGEAVMAANPKIQTKALP